MSIPGLLVAPSIWMQKTFFQFAETQRGVQIGREPSRTQSNLSIRIAALAHATLQLAYASVMAVPLALVSVGTVIATPSLTGFMTQNGGILERIGISALAAIGSLIVPAVAAIKTAFTPDDLNNTESFSVRAPIYIHGTLFACTLPSLPTIADRCAGNFSEAITRALGPGLLAGIASAAVRFVAGSGLSREALRQIEASRFQWRCKFGPAVADRMHDNIAHYDRAFRVPSEEFVTAVAAAVAAGRPPEEVAEQ